MRANDVGQLAKRNAARAPIVGVTVEQTLLGCTLEPAGFRLAAICGPHRMSASLTAPCSPSQGYNFACHQPLQHGRCTPIAESRPAAGGDLQLDP